MLIQFLAFLFLTSCSTIGLKSTKNEKLSRSYTQLATSLVFSGRYPEAIKEFENALSVDPDNFLAHHNLGIAYMSIHQLDLAEKSVRKALEINPKYTQGFNTLSKIFIEKKQYNRAIRLAIFTLQDLTYTGVATSYQNLGLAYLKKGKNKTAQAYLKKAISKNNKDCGSFFYYGLSLFYERDYEHSLATFQKTQRLCEKSNFQEPIYYTGLSLLKLGRKSEARTHFLRIIKNHPEHDYAMKAKKALSLTR